MGSINKYKIIRWYKMLTGKSIFHVNQGIGKIYSKKDIRGYYNDLTNKVIKGENELYHTKIPELRLEDGTDIIFPIAVFQYGLGLYDLYLLSNENLYLDKFKTIACWAVDNQQENGAWNNFFYIYPDNPYSAMAQGEGASLLIRAFKTFGEANYLDAAKKAIDFMLTPVEEGGTTLYIGDQVFLLEFTHKPIVLNGWIFALFGLFDYVKVSSDQNRKDTLHRILNSVSKKINYFDNGYWSMYNIDGIIASPFYHDLHIAQLNVLYNLFGITIFKEYCLKWTNYKNKFSNRNRAFIVKTIQKLLEK